MSAIPMTSSLDLTPRRGLLLGPACVIRHPVDRGVLKTVGEEIKAIGQG